MCIYIYIYIYISFFQCFARPRDNMVGVNMALALYPQNTLYHRIYIVHV